MILIKELGEYYKLIEKIKIIFFSLSFIHLAIGGYFFYLSKVKKLKIEKDIKLGKKNKGSFGISFDDDTGFFGGEDISLGEYKVSTVVKTINNFIESFNNTNKRVNLASGIISILAGVTLLLSGIILAYL